MNPVRVIGDRDTVLAFALGGVPGRVVESGDDARAAVEQAVDDVRKGGGPVERPTLVLVTHRTAERIREYLDAVILDARSPLVLEIPGFGAPEGESSVERFVRRVLGMHLQ